MSVNLEIKGMLAKLLATEDIVVEHKKVETACFNVHTRVLTKYADRQNKRITLTQDPDPGKKAKLAKFYKSHGFKKNSGRNRDFSTRDTDIRNPQA